MDAYCVYQNSVLLDVVFYTKGTPVSDVYVNLVSRDGYPTDIVVKRSRTGS